MRRLPMCLMLVSLLMALGGCVTGGMLPANPEKMSAEQLKEWVKDKNANAGCLVASTPYGKGNSVFLALDRGIVINGKLIIEDNCKVTIENTQKPLTPAP